GPPPHREAPRPRACRSSRCGRRRRGSSRSARGASPPARDRPRRWAGRAPSPTRPPSADSCRSRDSRDHSSARLPHRTYPLTLVPLTLVPPHPALSPFGGEGTDQTSQPPSTVTDWPVMLAESSETRNRTALAMSWAAVTRRSAISLADSWFNRKVVQARFFAVSPHRGSIGSPARMPGGSPVALALGE